MMLAEDILNLQEDPILVINSKDLLVFANNIAIKEGFVLPEYQNKSYYEVLRPLELISYITNLMQEDKQLKLFFMDKTYSIYRRHFENIYVIFMKDITKYENYQKAKREFIANASHELKTPISIISSVLDILLDKYKEDSVLKFIQKAKNACESMEAIINDMLTLSFVESMEDDVKIEDYVDVKSLIQDILESFQLNIREKSINVVVNVESQTIKTNKKLFETILKNLIDNAIKYNKQDGSIEIFSKKTEFFELFIKDTGIGIAKEHLPFIFERFYSTSKDRSYKSTGLGLAIVKHISKLLKINVEVNSTIDVGTTFRLVFLQT